MRGSRLLLLQVLLPTLVVMVKGDLFHYYKLKKFLTAVAFARALGKRPTILPVPIPIPIPIGQNEVIRLPTGGRQKTFLTLTGSPKYGGFGGGGFGRGGGGFGHGGVKYTGSSNYGYSLPGQFESSSLGGGSGSNVMVLNGNSVYDDAGGPEFASPSNVIRLVSGSGRPQRIIHKPRRLIIRGDTRTIKDTDLHYYVGEEPIIQKQQLSSGKRKKPIPVGEKFRLP